MNSPFQAWLQEHRKNPYPTKAEKSRPSSLHEDDSDPGKEQEKDRRSLWQHDTHLHTSDIIGPATNLAISVHSMS